MESLPNFIMKDRMTMERFMRPGEEMSYLHLLQVAQCLYRYGLELCAVLEVLKESYNSLAQRHFGRSTETVEISTEFRQLTIFDTFDIPRPEEPLPVQDETAAETKVEAYKRRPRKKKSEKYENIPEEHVLTMLSDEERSFINQYQATDEVIFVYDHEELVVTPPQLKLVKYFREKHFLKKATSGPAEQTIFPEYIGIMNTDHLAQKMYSESQSAVVAACEQAKLFQNSVASVSTVSYIMVEKFAHYMPFNRISKTFKQLGCEIRRELIGDWVMSTSEKYLEPLYEQMKSELLEREVIHCDETRGRVMREPNRKNTDLSYYWVYCSTEKDGLPPIVLYEYTPGRKGCFAEEFLETFNGYILTDFYDGYNNVKQVTRVLCWCHLRRRFYEACLSTAKEIEKGTRAPETPAEIGLSFINVLFALEKKFKNMTPDQRKEARKKESVPVLERFWNWLDTLDPLKGGKLDKAVTYARNGKNLFMNYLLDGKLDISNNRAENCIRPLAVSRKNSLINGSPEGAKAHAVCFSIVQTAIRNGLDAYKYLEYILERMLYYTPKKNSMLTELMPWAVDIQKNCSTPNPAAKTKESEESKQKEYKRFDPSKCTNYPEWLDHDYERRGNFYRKKVHDSKSDLDLKISRKFAV